MSVCIERDPDPTGSASFDGACYGWRIGPYRVMVAEGLDRNVHADCDVKLYGDSIETSGLPAADHPPTSTSSSPPFPLGRPSRMSRNGPVATRDSVTAFA